MHNTEFHVGDWIAIAGHLRPCRQICVLTDSVNLGVYDVSRFKPASSKTKDSLRSRMSVKIIGNWKKIDRWMRNQYECPTILNALEIHRTRASLRGGSGQAQPNILSLRLVVDNRISSALVWSSKYHKCQYWRLQSVSVFSLCTHWVLRHTLALLYLCRRHVPLPIA